jgi:hypothetical protein
MSCVKLLTEYYKCAVATLDERTRGFAAEVRLTGAGLAGNENSGGRSGAALRTVLDEAAEPQKLIADRPHLPQAVSINVALPLQFLGVCP